jgi:hypothetical protein
MKALDGDIKEMSVRLDNFIKWSEHKDTDGSVLLSLSSLIDIVQFWLVDRIIECYCWSES